MKSGIGAGTLMRWCLAAIVSWAFVAGAVASPGDGIAQLKQFVADAASAQGRFEQVVTASSGRRPQRASGHFAFVRPGQFRWVYETPYTQVLVSDGQRLWAWDEDLNQVTVKRLGDALGSTPAAILAGDGALERDFELSEAGHADGLAWVIALPRQSDSTFEAMRVGLADGMLRRMELRDHFGQTTVIDFEDVVTGAAPDPALFSFTPPPGADVIGD
ncbi:MAG TPA: outer membrane lipoprotein chaperone LolA [Rhodocyclaceae bacterium]|nr:outer membrane lipoprotein chaperone LolA [Rhodocyclaceae bacterium]